MFIAPLVASTTAERQPSASLRPRPSLSHLRARSSTAAHHALLAWMAIGLLLLVFVPATRGDGLLGATLPFWLVMAPALDLIWLCRRQVKLLVRTCERIRTQASPTQARRTRRAA